MLQLDDLRRLRSAAQLADVYHLLGYPSDTEAPDFAPADIGLEGAAAGDVSRVWMLADMDTLQHVHFEVRDLHAATLRRVTEQFLRRSGEYLLTFATPAFDRLVFVKPRRERLADAEADTPKKSSGLKLGKLSIQPSRPTQHDLSVLREIAVSGTQQGPYQAHLKQITAFNVERVTRRFFEEYKRLFHHVRATIAGENPGARIGPHRRNLTSDHASLHAFTQRLLGRIIFLYFIQKKGWLDGNQDFLPELYRCATEHPGANFYRDALEPLFFEVLNTERGGQGSPFGSVPYLNGSLFEREYPQDTVLNLPNALFDPKHAGSILNVLGGYNFTISESSSLEQEISLDPEMLGKVFENMMEEEEAAQSGTFYTPRSIVQFMAEETLTRYLADHTGISQDRLLPLTADDSDPHDLTGDEANRIITALGRVRVLDPAVGTASMLVGFLNAMIRVRRSAAARRGTQVSEGGLELAQWKREYIQHCLYGVDIKHEAIEIARLRLWLSLVVDAQESEPLPNLDYKLMAGDGLLETVDGAPFIRVEQAVVGDEAAIADKARAIEAGHEEFFGEQCPDQRRALREQIQTLERELFRADVDMRIKGLDSQIRLLDRQIADPHQAERTRGTLTKRRTALADNMGRLIEQKVKVWDEQEPLPFFLHNVHFAEVMRGENRGGNGGFDIVIGNPPYVGINAIDSEKKNSLKNAFPDVESGRADLYVYFYNKSINLVRDNGIVCLITSNKFIKGQYGKKLKDFLDRSLDLSWLINFEDLPVFDAAAYPVIVSGVKSKGSQNFINIVDKSSILSSIGTPKNVEDFREKIADFRKIIEAETVEQKVFSEGDWVIQGLLGRDLLASIERNFNPLNELVDGQIFRGLISGNNDVFLVGEDFREYIKDK